MPNFLEAFQDGLRAAETADRARHEVDEVFAELNRQLATNTGGKLHIAPMRFQKPTPWRSNPKHYWAIVASNPDVGEKSAMELADWSQDKAGYPCRMKSDATEYVCEDRMGLEEALAELLRDPLVADTIVKVMKHERASDAGQESPNDVE